MGISPERRRRSRPTRRRTTLAVLLVTFLGFVQSGVTKVTVGVEWSPPSTVQVQTRA